MDAELWQMFHHPTVQQTLKYSFVGSKETVKAGIQHFLQDTQIDELMVSTNVFGLENRIKSVELLAEIIKEINNN